jgi:hypothetical protein
MKMAIQQTTSNLRDDILDMVVAQFKRSLTEGIVRAIMTWMGT